MIKPIADQLTQPGQSRYALCVGVAKRAREITEEMEQSGELQDEKPVELAVEELQHHQYRIVESNRNEDAEADEAKRLHQLELAGESFDNEEAAVAQAERGTDAAV